MPSVAQTGERRRDPMVIPPTAPRHITRLSRIVGASPCLRKGWSRVYGICSEIRLVGLRDRHDHVIEEIQVVLGTDHFRHRSVGYAPPALDRRPRHIKGAGVIDCDDRLQRLAVLDHLEALNYMDLLRVGRAVIVDKRLVVEADGVDYEFVSLVMADRFAIPRRLRILRVRDVEVDTPRLMVEFAEERDRGGSLQEIQALHARVDGEAWNASRPTSLSRDEWNLPRQHIVVGF